MKLEFYKRKRPYKNFNDFLRRNGQRPDLEYPCILCQGNKVIIDPKEQPCPVDGHRFSDRIQCPSCKGTGSWSVKLLRQYYKTQMDEYKEDIRQWQDKTDQLKRILAKLSEAELDLLTRAIQGI